MRRARLRELDFFRAVSALSVVVIHIATTPLAEVEGPSASTLFYMLTRFSIAAYISIAAVALFYSYDPASFDTRVFLRKRVSFILIPYILLSGVYAVAGRLLGGAVSLRAFLVSMLLGSACYHLYFIILIFQFYLLFPWLLKIYRVTRRYEGWILGVCSVAFLGLMAWFRYGT